MHPKKAVVIHSGGMDSSLCLALAAQEFGKEHVLSLSFNYQQRHSPELIQAAKICQEWSIDHNEIPLACLPLLTQNALTHPAIPIEHKSNTPASTLVVGRNGLMAWLGGIHAQFLGAHCIYMGIMEQEAANTGYRDCSRTYMDAVQALLRIELDDPTFEIRTPLVHLTKRESFALTQQLGLLDYLWEHSISCYNGLPQWGCRACPACLLRNDAYSACFY